MVLGVFGFVLLCFEFFSEWESINPDGVFLSLKTPSFLSFWKKFVIYPFFH